MGGDWLTLWPARKERRAARERVCGMRASAGQHATAVPRMRPALQAGECRPTAVLRQHRERTWPWAACPPMQPGRCTACEPRTELDGFSNRAGADRPRTRRTNAEPAASVSRSGQARRPPSDPASEDRLFHPTSPASAVSQSTRGAIGWDAGRTGQARQRVAWAFEQRARHHSEVECGCKRLRRYRPKQAGARSAEARRVSSTDRAAIGARVRRTRME